MRPGAGAGGERKTAGLFWLRDVWFPFSSVSPPHRPHKGVLRAVSPRLFYKGVLRAVSPRLFSWKLNLKTKKNDKRGTKQNKRNETGKTEATPFRRPLLQNPESPANRLIDTVRADDRTGLSLEEDYELTLRDDTGWPTWCWKKLVSKAKPALCFWARSSWPGQITSRNGCLLLTHVRVWKPSTEATPPLPPPTGFSMQGGRIYKKKRQGGEGMATPSPLFQIMKCQKVWLPESCAH